MIKIYLKETLEYYDGILLFTGKDPFGSHYLCSLYLDEQNNEEYYLSVRVSEQRIRDLFNHTLDLRTALLQPEVGGEYFRVDWENAEHFEATPFPNNFKPSDNMLPDDGYYCDSLSMDNELSQCLLDKRRPIFTIGADDTEGSHSISTKVASSILDGITSMFNATLQTNGEDLEIVATQAASFNFILATRGDVDLFSQVPGGIENAFIRMEYLLSLIQKQDLSGEEYTERELSSLLKLAKTYADNNLSLKYSYIKSANDEYTEKSYIKNSDIVSFHSLNQHTREREEETGLEQSGTFQRCDNKTGDWVFITTEGSEIKGKSHKDALRGVVIADKEYTITYRLLKETSGTGRETHSLSLIKFT